MDRPSPWHLVPKKGGALTDPTGSALMKLKILSVQTPFQSPNCPLAPWVGVRGGFCFPPAPEAPPSSVCFKHGDAH